MKKVDSYMRKKRSKLLLVAAIISVLCLAYTWNYISGASAGLSSTNAGTATGTAIAISMVMPHMALATLGTIFCCLGWLINARWAALVAGILFAVALVLMFPWFYFVIIQMILCFIAYAKMEK